MLVLLLIYSTRWILTTQIPAILILLGLGLKDFAPYRRSLVSIQGAKRSLAATVLPPESGNARESLWLPFTLEPEAPAAVPCQSQGSRN
ncbi:MAG: hypothetical protein VKL39_15410 [Leptolyngbyaceae bacterium]|nr:hypothetical protein [Leptolyngbyaceae bacterium]